MKLFTIGFTRKSAEEFFNLLISNKVRIIIDVRRNNKSQLAGFTKEKNLKFFLNKIAKIEYLHLIEFSPTQSLLKRYRKKDITWNQFEKEYLAQIKEFNQKDTINIESFKDGCLLCSEFSPLHCHRRLFAEYLEHKFQQTPFEIIHL